MPTCPDRPVGVSGPVHVCGVTHDPLP
jgi:hypothetical protein